MNLFELYDKYYYNDKVIGFNINGRRWLYDRYHFSLRTEFSVLYYKELQKLNCKKWKLLKK